MTKERPLEFVAFDVAGQEFCADVKIVREIRGWAPATTLPHNPSYMKGVIEVKGALLPIIDLADRFGLSAVQATARHAIIVVEVGGEPVGLLVNAVSDIVRVERHRIQLPLSNASDRKWPFVTGFLALGDRMIRLIDVDRILETTGVVTA